MKNASTIHDIIVIGAGLAGLTAATRLRRAGRDVVVLEAADRIGGRLLRQTVGGVTVDGGGAWVAPTQHRVRALLDEVGLTLRPTYTEGRHVVRVDGAVHTGRGTIPPLPFHALADGGLAVARLELMARLLPLRSRQLDTKTFGDWMRRHTRSQGARTMLEIAVSATTGSSVDDVSLLAIAQMIRSAGGFHQLTGVHGAAQDARIVGGSVSLCDRLADRLGPSRIHLGAAVTAVEQSSDTVTVRVVGGRTVRASRVITAIDPGMCARIDFGAGLPAPRRALHDTFTMGSGIKFHLAYDTPFWRHRGFSGQAFTDDGMVGILFDATADACGPGVLVGFLGGFAETSNGDERPLTVTNATRAAQIGLEVEQLFGAAPSPPIDYCEQDWREEPHVSGCVPAPAPGVLSAIGPAPVRPYGRLHWAGAEFADAWSGYMDGAVRSGERAAAEVA
ncbi:flavin monoamine oxidase family protein [Mycolicibacterium hodleri]|nr:FAD-dependent oxidoreductase [Mycolicibacterium hodleri]